MICRIAGAIEFTGAESVSMSNTVTRPRYDEGAQPRWFTEGRATLRERDPNFQWSTVTRLPSWIKQGKHRRAILKGLARLREALVA